MEIVKFTIEEGTTFVPEAAAEHSITVRELIEVLNTFPSNTKIICDISNVSYNNFPYVEINRENFQFNVI